ncbi:MAG: HAMP domain-containing histidine kinase, partial [Anaerolineae bacterium]|nr:HAMP domain-containing histidine kinase [Anaerolineae bacterium]
MRLYLTPAAVGYLTQFLLAILISGYLLWLVRTPHHPRHARWLIGFFICIALFIATLFFEVTLLPTQRLRVVYVQNTALGVALVFLIQFAYRFPVLAPARRWEARVALALSSLYTLWEAAYALYRFLRLGYGEVVYRPNWSDYLLLAVLLWTPLAFLRQLYILEHPTGGRWRRFISPLLHPSNRTARTVRDFTLVFLFVASLNVFNILRASYLVTVSLANMGISLGILLALFAFAMIYLNGHPETTSFIVKLAGVVLTLMLAVLGIVAWVVAPFYIAEYEPALPRRQTLRFVPNALGGYDISAHPLTYESDLGSPLILTEGLPYQKEYVALCSEPLGFRFPFYGQTYQQIYVCNDGALGIGQALEPRNYQYRFGAGRPLIMALFIDLHPDISPEGVYVRLEPERLLVTWRQQRAFRDPEQSYTFQAALYKDGVFELSYRDLPATFTYQPNDAPEANPWAIGALPGGPGHITPDLWRSEALPFSGGPEGVVQDYLLAFRQRLHNVLAPLAWLILGASAIIVIGLPLLIYTGLVQPLNALLRGVQRIEAGEYHTQVPVRYTDEIGFLTQAFNHLAAELDALIHGLETQVAIRTATLDEVNAQLRAEIAQREELITELQTFSHTVAHDLKTPLSIIGGYSYLISEDLSGKGETRLAGFAGQVVHTIEKMGRIIDSILSFANVRQAEVTLRRIDMQAIVDEVLLDLHPLIAEVGAHPDYPEEWPAALGHPQWVAQIWSNYLSNALKYGICTGEAPPVSELGYVCCPAGVYRFWVRDHGPGLSQEQQAALFTPFRRVHKGPNEGTGLGLSIVKRMVEKMGGQVGVDSAPGEGSRFWFTLLPDTGDVDTLSSLPAVVVPETTLVHRLARFQETTLSQLADAARDTEFTVLQELIAQITQVDAVAGCALGDLLNNFDYEILLTLALNA